MADLKAQLMKMKKELDLLKCVLELLKADKANKESMKMMQKDNKFLSAENNCACDKGFMIGDGNTTYSEWFEEIEGYLGEDTNLEEYKEWMGYDKCDDVDVSDEED